MKPKIMKEYKKDGFLITEYTKNGKDVSHYEKKPIQNEKYDYNPEPSDYELQQSKILLNTELLLIYGQLGMEMK